MPINFLDLSPDVLLEIAHQLRFSFPENSSEITIIKNLMDLASCSRYLYPVISPLAFKKLAFTRYEDGRFTLLELCTRLATDETYSPVWLSGVTHCRLVRFTDEDPGFPFEIYIKALARFSNLVSLSFEQSTVPGNVFDIIGPYIKPQSLVFYESDFPVRKLVACLCGVARLSGYLAVSGPQGDVLSPVNQMIQMHPPPYLEIHYPQKRQTLADLWDVAESGIGGLLTKLSVCPPMDLNPGLFEFLYETPLLESLEIPEVIVPSDEASKAALVGLAIRRLPSRCLPSLRKLIINPDLLPCFSLVLPKNQGISHLDLTGYYSDDHHRPVPGSEYTANTNIDFSCLDAPLANIVQLSIRIDSFLLVDLLPVLPNLQSLHLINVSSEDFSNSLTDLAERWPSRIPPITEVFLESMPESVENDTTPSTKYVYGELDLKWQYYGAKALSKVVPSLLRFRCGDVVFWTRQGPSTRWTPLIPEDRKEEVKSEILRVRVDSFWSYALFLTDHDRCIQSLFQGIEIPRRSPLSQVMAHLNQTSG